jgi:hypothetical protein
MSFRTAVLVSLVSVGAAFAQQPPVPPAPPRAPMPPPPPRPPGPVGIPPPVAQKLGLSPETVQKVRDLSFDANDALISLEADLKRAQLQLERTLAAPQVEESVVMSKLEAVSRAELAVKKNRLGLTLRLRKLLGPDVWDRLQAELPSQAPAPGMMMLVTPPQGPRRDVQVITPEPQE